MSSSARMAKSWPRWVLRSSSGTSRRAPPGDTPAEDKTVVYSMAFSPDGQTLASGGENVYASLWDVNAIRPSGPRPDTISINSLACSPDGKILALAE